MHVVCVVYDDDAAAADDELLGCGVVVVMVGEGEEEECWEVPEKRTKSWNSVVGERTTRNWVKVRVKARGCSRERSEATRASHCGNSFSWATVFKSSAKYF
ncbi:hypothetical protein VNO80_17717 [Phaseolus coccineus]|uniref:Uncharacterized protein n=1 Tax=Phaseolus coccineus TaxID=3886 RepID=A0AAN9MI06_PHACN